MRTGAAAFPGARAANLLTLVALASIGLLFIGGGWVSDDFVHVHRLTHLSSSSSLVGEADGFGFYRPVAQISF